jgi:hypothetical protein
MRDILDIEKENNRSQQLKVYIDIIHNIWQLFGKDE